MPHIERGDASPSPESLDSPSKTKGKPVLLMFDELPHWHQDNEFIRHGYRPISGSAPVSLRSWLYLHNESVNIFSHLIPAILSVVCLCVLYWYLSSNYDNVTGTDIFIFVFFLLTAVICLGLSATYHTLMNHSHEVEQMFLRFDLVGIAVLTIGDFVSGIYMIFWCEPLQRNIYWSMIGILGSATIIIMLMPHFRGKKFRIFRALSFVGTGLSGFAPLIHGIQMFGLDQMMKQSGLPYYLAEAFCLLSGAVIYVTKFPESRYPGKFDIFGSSHQLFHILVVLATTSQLAGILVAYDYNSKYRQCSAH